MSSPTVQNRWQHFVSQTYLKPFASDSKRKKVWKYDGAAPAQNIDIKKSCAGEWHYSSDPKNDPFQRGETFYGEVAKKLWSDLNFKERFGLVLFMLEMHLRNPVYQNEAGGERITAYNNAKDIFLQNLMLGQSELTDERCAKVFNSLWTVEIVRTGGDILITSDNPSILSTGSVPGSQPTMILMPVNSTTLAVAFIRKVHSIRTTVTSSQDAKMLNLAQCKQAIEAIYLHRKPTEQEIGDFQPILTQSNIPSASAGFEILRSPTYLFPKPFSFIS